MLRFIVLWGVTGCKAVAVIKSDRRVSSPTQMPSSPPSGPLPRYHQGCSATYLTFPDQAFCIIFTMTFSVTYFISDNGTLNLVKCITVKCVCFGEGDWTDWQGLCSRAETIKVSKPVSITDYPAGKTNRFLWHNAGSWTWDHNRNTD